MIRRPIVTVFLAALVLGSCADSGKTSIVVYSAHGRDILLQFERAFEAAHPHVDVATVYLGAQDLAERIRAERENPQAAVWWGSDSTAMDKAADEGLLLAYTPTYATPDLPRHEKDLWTGCFTLPIVIGYHPARLTPEELPKRFSDLANPKYRGKIVLREPAPSGTLRTFIAATIARAVAEDGGDAAAFRFLKGLHENVHHYEGSAELLWEALEAGPGAITVWNLTDFVFQRREKGYHFLPAPLAEPVPVIVDAIALVDGPGGRTQAARDFYEFVNSLDAMKILAREHGRIPVRKDFDPSLLLEEIRAVPFEPMKLDRAVMNANVATWMARFEMEIRGRR